MERDVPIPPRPDLGVPSPPAVAEPPRGRAPWIAVLAAVLAIAISAAAIARPGDDVRGEFRFLGALPNGAPFRWNPCQPIHYEVNLTHAPVGALADVREAASRASEATGIAFAYDGETVRTPDQQIGSAFQTTVPGQARWLPLLFAWVPHQHFDFIVDTHRAAAFGLPDRGDGTLSNTYVSGVIAVDLGGPLPPGFAGRYSLGPVLMHELGHILGLAHVGSAHELMWSPEVAGAAKAPDLHQTDWGPGDLEGLARLGRSAGCLPARDPPV
jgi:hypothetical protein